MQAGPGADDRPPARRARLLGSPLSLTALALIGFALRVYHLSFQSLWRDEVDAVFFATREFSKLVWMFTAAGENGPLYFLLLRPWIAVVGRSEFAVRYLSVAFGALAVLLVYRLGREFRLSRAAAFVGAGLAACSPYLVWYSQEAKMYALLVCLSAGATISLLRALRGAGRRWWVAYVVLVSLSFYIHLLAVTLLPFHALLFLLGGRRHWLHWRGALLSLAALTLPYVPFLRWEVRTWLGTFQTGHPFYPLPEIASILLGVHGFGLRAPRPAELALLLFVILLGTLLYRGRAPLARRPQLTLWLYLALPVLTVFAISLGMPIFTDRYLIGIAPAFCLLLACGIAAAWGRSRLLGAVCLIGLLAVDGQGLWMQSQTVIKADFRSAAAYYAAHSAPDDLLVFQMPYVRRSFDFYYEPRYRFESGLYTNRGMTPAEVDSEMVRLTSGRAVVWLFESEAPTWDRRALVKAWLETKGRATGQADFQHIRLTRFELKPASPAAGS